MKERFIAKHRQTGERVVGTFEQLQDLDKRLWDLQPVVARLNDMPITKAEYASVVGPDPIADVLVRRDDNSIWKNVWVTIFYQDEFCNLHL